MKFLSRTTGIIIFITFNLLIIQDFFPDSIFIAKKYLLMILISTLIFSLFFPEFRKKKSKSLQDLVFELGLMIYILILIIILELVGGESDLSLTHPFSLFMVFLCLAKMISSMKKYKKADNNIAS